jgi:L-ascorbate metabolism protein UlaG (beta-lactamase superfamily)
VIGGVQLKAAGAKHVGSRYAVDRWRSDASMYLLDAGPETVFFAGDTALTPETHHLVRDHVVTNGRQLDVALLPIGHAPWWKFNFRRGHLTSDDALTLFERLDAKVLIPYHWGTFQHVTAGAHDAIVKLRERLPKYGRHHQVKIIEPGEAFELEPAACGRTPRRTRCPPRSAPFAAPTTRSPRSRHPQDGARLRSSG